jgi:hypothetical protein
VNSLLLESKKAVQRAENFSALKTEADLSEKGVKFITEVLESAQRHSTKHAKIPNFAVV